ncbi:MAG: hypothetical protein IJ179_07195 [Oscillospiraceae bacterium]|nr:hypothetical protein [Oscillospiraceae bacterium]
MKREAVAEIMGLLDAELVAQAIGYPGAQEPARKTKGTARRLAVLALAACLLLALSATAYAANLWGIRELFHTATQELPESAGTLIQPQEAAAQGDGWGARITESLCDADTVLVAVTVTAGEDYILAPTDAAEEDPLWAIGREGDGTLADYAAQQGKKILTVGAALPWEELNVSGQSQRAEQVSDSELVLLLVADKDRPLPQPGTVCTVYARVIDSEEVERLEIPLTMTESETRELGTFIPEDPNAIPGMTVGEALVTESALGLTIRYPVMVTDREAFDRIMKTDFAELTSYYSGGIVQDETGALWARFTMCRGEVGDTLTARCYDWDKQRLGQIIFRKR